MFRAFDAAIEAELPRVSHLEYDSHEICKHFASKVRAAMLQHVSLIDEGDNYPVIQEGSVPEVLRTAINKLFDNDGWRKCYSAIAC